MVKEDQWGYLECLHKACQAAITDGGLFTDTEDLFNACKPPLQTLANFGIPSTRTPST